MSGDEQRMTSLEIAEVIGKQHNHVMRDIRFIGADAHTMTGPLCFIGIDLGGTGCQSPSVLALVVNTLALRGHVTQWDSHPVPHCRFLARHVATVPQCHRVC